MDVNITFEFFGKENNVTIKNVSTEYQAIELLKDKIQIIKIEKLNSLTYSEFYFETLRTRDFDQKKFDELMGLK